MGIIALEGLEFFAYHGYYEEEQKIGNRYQVDIQITTDLTEAAEEDKLGGTVNYEDLYRIIASIMNDKIKLLEHIAQRIIHQVRIQYPAVSEIKVGVSKLNPPIGGVCERAKIILIG